MLLKNRIQAFILITAVIAIQACGGKKKSATTEQKVDSATIPPVPNPRASNMAGLGFDEFLQNFEKAALSHDPLQLMQFMNKDYKTEQHDKFLAGNTDKFFSVFFSGEQKNADGGPLINYKKISSLEKVSTTMLSTKDVSVTYKVKAEGLVATPVWVIMSSLNKEGKVAFSFYGKIN